MFERKSLRQLRSIIEDRGTNSSSWQRYIPKAETATRDELIGVKNYGNITNDEISKKRVSN